MGDFCSASRQTEGMATIRYCGQVHAHKMQRETATTLERESTPSHNTPSLQEAVHATVRSQPTTFDTFDKCDPSFRPPSCPSTQKTSHAYAIPRNVNTFGVLTYPSASAPTHDIIILLPDDHRYLTSRIHEVASLSFSKSDIGC